MNIRQIDKDSLSSSAKIAFSNIDMAIARMNLKDFDSAYILLKRAVNEEEVRELAMIKLSVCITALGRLEEGLQMINQAIDEYGITAGKLDSKARILKTMGKIDEWGRLQEEAVKLHPKAPFFWYNLACYYAYIDDPEKCRHALNKSVQIRPNLNSTAASDSDFEQYFNEDWFKDIVAFK